MGEIQKERVLLRDGINVVVEVADGLYVHVVVVVVGETTSTGGGGRSIEHIHTRREARHVHEAQRIGRPVALERHVSKSRRRLERLDGTARVAAAL